MDFTVIQVYAPIPTSTGYEINAVYEHIQLTIDSVNKRDITVFIGDLHTKVGRRCTNTNSMGN